MEYVDFLTYNVKLLLFICGIGIMVVLQPSKLATRVRFSYSAPDLNDMVIRYAHVKKRKPVDKMWC